MVLVEVDSPVGWGRALDTFLVVLVVEGGGGVVWMVWDEVLLIATTLTVTKSVCCACALEAF